MRKKSNPRVVLTELEKSSNSVRIYKKYKVDIPKKYRRELSKRFNYKNIKDGRINIRCPLCDDFRYRGTCSKKCPFEKFISSCDGWFDKVLPKKQVDMLDSGKICFGPLRVLIHTDNKKDVKEFFKVLREKAKQYIRFM